MLFLVPFDSTEVKVHLPVGSQIDRFAIVGLVFMWIWFGGDQRAFLRTRRSKLYVGAACVFLTLAVASLLFDVGRIINVGEFTLAEKRFALLGSFLILAWFTLAALRYEDVRGFMSYVIGLSTVTAVGIIIERKTGYNVFYNLSGADLRSRSRQSRRRRPSSTPRPPTAGGSSSWGRRCTGLLRRRCLWS